MRLISAGWYDPAWQGRGGVPKHSPGQSALLVLRRRIGVHRRGQEIFQPRIPPQSFDHRPGLIPAHNHLDRYGEGRCCGNESTEKNDEIDELHDSTFLMRQPNGWVLPLKGALMNAAATLLADKGPRNHRKFCPQSGHTPILLRP